MKPIQLIFLFSVFSLAAHAQQLKSANAIKGKQTEFTLTHKGKSVFINDRQNPYVDKKPKVMPSAIHQFVKKDESTVSKAFHEAFSAQRLNQLLPENALLINYYVDATGKVQYVSFLTLDTTTLNALELEALQTALKKYVSFNVNPNETKGGDFFVFSQAVKYAQIIASVQ